MDLVRFFEKTIVIGSRFDIVPIRRQVLVESGHMRAAHRAIRLPDAIHVATARQERCSVFLSGDLRRAPPDGIGSVRLSANCLSEILGSTD